MPFSPGVAQWFKIISVPSKTKILFTLGSSPHCVCDLMTHTKLSQTLISHHLSDLAAAGLVRSDKNGAFMDYSLTEKGRDLMDAVREIIQSDRAGDVAMSKKP